jgi:hypothetical protein
MQAGRALGERMTIRLEDPRRVLLRNDIRFQCFSPTLVIRNKTCRWRNPPNAIHRNRSRLRRSPRMARRALILCDQSNRADSCTGGLFVFHRIDHSNAGICTPPLLGKSRAMLMRGSVKMYQAGG